MKKTKTAEFILNKQKRGRDVSVKQSPVHLTNRGGNQTGGLGAHLSFMNVIDFVYQPKLKGRRDSGAACDECCELERQNYRLIESNYGMIQKHRVAMDAIKVKADAIICMIEEYHYVDAIRIAYDLIDRIKDHQYNPEDKSTDGSRPKLIQSAFSSLVSPFCHSEPKKSSPGNYQQDIATHNSSQKVIEFCYSPPLHSQQQSTSLRNQEQSPSFRNQSRSPSRNRNRSPSRNRNRSFTDHAKQSRFVGQVGNLDNLSLTQRSCPAQNISETGQVTPLKGGARTEDLHRLLLIQASSLEVYLQHQTY